MDAGEQALDILHKLLAKLKGLSNNDPVELGGFFIILTFILLIVLMMVLSCASFCCCRKAKKGALI